MNRGPWLAQLMALEDLAVEVLDADVINVEPPRGQLGRALARRGRAREWATRIGYRAMGLSAGPPSRPYDLLLVHANDVSQVRAGLAEVLPELGRFAHARALYLSEVWASEIDEHPTLFDDVLGAFTHVFSSLEGSVGPLRARARGDVHLLPTGADVTAMSPWPVRRPPIDLTSLGRKAGPQHEALRVWARRTNRFYFYDVTPPGDVADFSRHREGLANHLVHTAAWVTNCARFDEPARTGGIEEVGLRFYEALAGGCLMLGQLPTSSRTFQSLFADLPGMIDMPTASTIVPERIDRFLDDSRLLLAARAAHRRRALEVGDISHMLVAMLRACGLPVPQALGARVAGLMEEAQAIQS